MALLFSKVAERCEESCWPQKIFLAHIGGRTDMEWETVPETLNHFDGRLTKKEDWVNAAQVEFYVVVF